MVLGWSKEDQSRLAKAFESGSRLFPKNEYLASKYYYVVGNKEKSRLLRIRASEKGNGMASLDLGWSYLGGGWPVTEVDPFRAREFLQKAGEQGRASGWVELGRLYQDGRGGEMDDAKALECFQRAESIAARYLGMAYFHGRGTPRDYPKARHYLELDYERDINQNRYIGSPELVRIYSEGLGTPADPVLAACYSPLDQDWGSRSSGGTLSTFIQTAHDRHQSTARYPGPCLLMAPVRPDAVQSLPFFVGREGL